MPGWRKVRSHVQIAPIMAEFEYLTTQARKCRTLAGGLTNREDVRKLEDLALEFEARARAARPRPSPAEQAAAA